jgi:transcriptional regulator with XRE-family HTH domain
MSTFNTAPDAALLAQIGERLAAHRLARNLTQAELAEQAGLGLRTVQRLEAGAAATHLSGFLRVCRVLGLLDRPDAPIPALAPSPMAQLKSARKQRKRATRANAAARRAKPWTWGDDA